MPQENLQRNIFDNNSKDNLSPESLAMQKAKNKAAATTIKNANYNIKQSKNVIAGKFTKENQINQNQEADEQRSQANEYLSKSQQSQIDAQQKYANNSENDNLSEAAKRVELDREYRENKNRYNYNNGKDNNNYSRARAMNLAANDNQNKQRKNTLAQRISAVQRVFREEKIVLSEREAESILNSGFKVPFPAFMFMFALLKDVSDIFITIVAAGLTAAGTALTASLAGAPVGGPLLGISGAMVMINTLVITPIYLFIFNIWLRKYGQDKNNFKAATKLSSKVVSRMMPRIVVKMIVEIIPIINMLPMNTANVISIYRFFAKLARKCKAAVG